MPKSHYNMPQSFLTVQLSISELRTLISEVVELQLQTLIPQLIKTGNKEDPMDDFVTIAVACRLLHKSKPTIYRLLRTGVLTPYRIIGTKSMLLSKSEIIKTLNKSNGK